MGKTDGLSRRSGKETFGLEGRFFDEGQLLDLEEDDTEERGYADDLELEGINIASWEKKNGLWVVPEEHKLEVLR